jgi:lycopene cyclase domain-containing protein
VGHLTYLALLAGCLVVTAPLEIVLKVRVYARWRRFLLAVLPEFAVFVVWVLYAIAQGHWDYSDELTLGLRLSGGIPLEEVLFFLAVPLCSVLAFEAVRKVTGWDAGYPSPDDSPGNIAARPVPTGSEHRSERQRARSGASTEEPLDVERGADRGAESGTGIEEADR